MGLYHILPGSHSFALFGQYEIYLFYETMHSTAMKRALITKKTLLGPITKLHRFIKLHLSIVFFNKRLHIFQF